VTHYMFYAGRAAFALRWSR